MTVSAGITTSANGTVSLEAGTGAMAITGAGIGADGAVTLAADLGISTASPISTTGDAIVFANNAALTADVAINATNGPSPGRVEVV